VQERNASLFRKKLKALTSDFKLWSPGSRRSYVSKEPSELRQRAHCPATA
jgi:hypothetical protein